ncbi:P-loop containing nucleoside triphosphate hydrolase protein [Mucor ambiguus]|uniref:p-loop containing nucleoside triphosphate hydrolase protein n=1 Tax=Mucor ambiguus TaxID=91626 RepID=A0A0C9MDN7_9FUNG|nr:P-loop containing nucleoside triphosphate hydrolase protein [Mucor ambiguus]
MAQSIPYGMLPQTKESLSHILKHYESFKQDRKSRGLPPQPMIVGVSGCQGSGKTTLCDTLAHLLKEAPYSLRVVSFSLDDVYLTHQDQVKLAQKYPNNPLYQQRGQAGSHDLSLASETLQLLLSAKKQGETVPIPVYDKSLHSGQGDRLDKADWKYPVAPFDIILFEGWMLGFKRLPEKDVKQHTNLKFDQVNVMNTELQKYEDDLYPYFDIFIHLSPFKLDQVYQWRLQQEHHMKQTRGVNGLSDEAVRMFVDTYMPAYELYLPRLDKVGFYGQGYLGEQLKSYEGLKRSDGGYSEPNRHLRVVLDQDRKVIASGTLREVVMNAQKVVALTPSSNRFFSKKLIENDKEIPTKVLKQKTKSKGLLYTVFFYGSRDYGFFGPDCIRPFDREAVERDLKDKKFKTKDLENAVHQALDPSILRAQEEAEAAAAAEEEDEDEPEEGDEEEDKAAEDEDDEEEEEEPVVKPKRKDRKKPVSAADKKKKTPTTKKRTASKKNIENEEEDDDAEDNDTTSTPPPSSTAQPKKTKTTTKKASPSEKKRARLSEPESATETDRKKRRKSLSTEQEEDHHTKRESSAVSRKSEEPNNHNTVGHIEKQEDLDMFKKTPEYKKIYHIRHKLQKLVYEKKPGEIAKDDFARVSQVVKEIEDSQMTYDLLRYTKIGKVVKFACSYDYGDDEHKINQRCQQLMKNWKSLIIPENRSASVEQHEQQS